MLTFVLAADAKNLFSVVVANGLARCASNEIGEPERVVFIDRNCVTLALKPDFAAQMAEDMLNMPGPGRTDFVFFLSPDCNLQADVLMKEIFKKFIPEVGCRARLMQFVPCGDRLTLVTVADKDRCY